MQSELATNTANGGVNEPEFLRQDRLIDQWTEIHASLSDKYRIVETGIQISILTLSAVSASFAFACASDRIDMAFVSARRATLLGILAMVAFVLSMIELVLRPGERAEQHRESVRSLARLKVSYREHGANDDPERLSELSALFHSVAESLAKIPNAYYARGKSLHLTRRQVSSVLTQNPGLSARAAKRMVKAQAKAASKQPRAN